MKELYTNTIYLPVGPRGAGKTWYVRRLLENNPDLQVVSKDEILMRVCGTVNILPNSPENTRTATLMYRLVRGKLSSKQGVKLLLDFWMLQSASRRGFVSGLRSLGVRQVIALYFITPVELVETWFWQKPGIAKMSEAIGGRQDGVKYFMEDTPRSDYEFFHEQASGIDEEGFDEVWRIDPTKELVALS